MEVASDFPADIHRATERASQVGNWIRIFPHKWNNTALGEQ